MRHLALTWVMTMLALAVPPPSTAEAPSDVQAEAGAEASASAAEAMEEAPAGETEGATDDTPQEPEGATDDTPQEPEGAADDTPQEPEGAADDTPQEPEGAADDTPQELEGFAGTVLKVMAHGLLVRRAGRPTDPTAPAFMLFSGKLGVPVEGQGKDNWMALRRGDVVMVSYAKGPPHRAVRVNVLRKPDRSTAVPRTGPRKKPPHRSFLGYVKQKQGNQLIVKKPSAPPPAQRPAETKAFIRTDDTKVEMLRESWEEIRKGDRVRLAFQKGNPRPLEAVQVLRKGGEEPLPPGVATRLFDPRYDESVKDVDGIGETGPVPEPTGAGRSRQLIRIKRKRPID